ncbi:MAG: hypothetical protein Q8R92_16715 [Deltaproteobacteria bacterium]|nr:hypothetical protein [Deltaproteobacteria bacterium]
MQWAERVAASLGLDLGSGVASLQRVESAERVRGLLLKVIADGADVYGDFVSPFERQHLAPLHLRADELELAVLRAPAGFRPQLRLFFGLGTLTYSFEAEVTRQSESEIAVRLPRVLDFGEQRHARRWDLHHESDAAPHIQLNGQGSPRYPLQDLSLTGFSLHVPDGDLPFESGRRISGLKVRVKGNPVDLPSVEIRHITTLDGSRGWRVGVEVGLLRRPIRARHLDFPLDEGARKRRHARTPAGRQGEGAVDVVRFFNRRGERIVGILDSTFGDAAKDPVPVVILPPATGRRKETLSALALTIV